MSALVQTFLDKKETSPQREASVLIVDDYEQGRAILANRLAQLNYHVVEAGTGAEALSAIAGQSFDVVLLDRMMPDVDGLETLRHLRETYTPGELPIIVVSALADPGGIVEAFELGANDYIAKPYNVPVALSRIKTQVAHRRTQVDDERRHAAPASANVGQVAFLAYHDGLTGLPNRAAYEQKLRAAIRSAERDPLAMLFIDLDGFKVINDTLGHEVGDAVLRRAAEAFGGVIGPGDFLARLGGDEFAILHASPDPRSTSAKLARRLIDAVNACRIVGEHEVYVGASIGIAIAEGGDEDPLSLVRKADLAMYRAKADGRGAFRFFTDDLQRSAARRRQLEVALRSANANGELSLNFQPIYAFGARRVTGLEALMRWTHPEFGPVSADEFIPIAEDTGLIVPLGDWALREACAAASRWPEDIRLAVNLSPRQFADAGLAASVTNALATAGLAPHRLELEITERLFLGSSEGRARATIEALQGLGVQIALDDFGVGCAGFAYLRDFRFDRLKIDKSFVEPAPEQATSAAIVRAALELSRNLGMKTIGEGVETPAAFELLRDLGCDEAQGYFVGRPTTLEDALKAVRSDEARLAALG